jgi:ABC-type multidrug transport system ATPase subunit
MTLRRIAIMPESPGLYQRLSVAENLECGFPDRLTGL